MTEIELKDLKKKVKKLLDGTDERVLRMLQAMLKADAEWQNTVSNKPALKK